MFGEERDAGAAMFFGPNVERLKFERRKRDILREGLVDFWKEAELSLR